MLSWFDFQSKAAQQGSVYLQRLKCDESAYEFKNKIEFLCVSQLYI